VKYAKVFLYFRNMNASEGPYCYAFFIFTVFSLNPWTVLKVKIFNTVSYFPTIFIVLERLASGYYRS